VRRILGRHVQWVYKWLSSSKINMNTTVPRCYVMHRFYNHTVFSQVLDLISDFFFSSLLSRFGTRDLLVLALKGMICQKTQHIWSTYHVTNTTLSYKTPTIIRCFDIRDWTWVYLNNYQRTGRIPGSQQIISELILLAKVEEVMMISIFSNQLCNYIFIIIIHCVTENISRLPVNAHIIMYNITVHVKPTKISISTWRDYVC
jgi:hypothetical protein